MRTPFALEIRRWRRFAILAFHATLFAGFAAGEEVAPPQTGGDSSAAPPPLWEAGIGAVAGAITDYPASDRYRVRALPLPYFIYRGDSFRSDSAGTRLRTGTGDLEWEFSGGGSLASDSQSGARAGMPRLDYVLEAGPKAKLTLMRPTPTSRLLFDLSLRAAASTDFSTRFRSRGGIAEPDVMFVDEAMFGSQWSGRVSLGVEVATAGLQRFYYDVAPQYAAPGRPAYASHAGVLGSSMTLAAYRPLKHDLHVFFAIGLDSYRGAANEHSPLSKTTGDIGAAVGFAWSFKQSAAPALRSR